MNEQNSEQEAAWSITVLDKSGLRKGCCRHLIHHPTQTSHLLCPTFALHKGMQMSMWQPPRTTLPPPKPPAMQKLAAT